MWEGKMEENINWAVFTQVKMSNLFRERLSVNALNSPRFPQSNTSFDSSTCQHGGWQLTQTPPPPSLSLSAVKRSAGPGKIHGEGRWADVCPGLCLAVVRYVKPAFFLNRQQQQQEERRAGWFSGASSPVDRYVSQVRRRTCDGSLLCWLSSLLSAKSGDPLALKWLSEIRKEERAADCCDISLLK